MKLCNIITRYRKFDTAGIEMGEIGKQGIQYQLGTADTQGQSGDIQRATKPINVRSRSIVSAVTVCGI